MAVDDTQLSQDDLVFQYESSSADNVFTSLSQESMYVSVARQTHVDGAKCLADANRHIFGFITKRAFYDAFNEGSLIVALQNEKVVGFLRYHHRKRDLQTTLYDICVAEAERGKKFGKVMLQMLIDCCHQSHRALILLKCPTHLAANTFYEKNGFRHIDTIAGKRQKLNVWQLDLTNGGHQ